MEKLILPLTIAVLCSTASANTPEKHTLKKEKHMILEVAEQTPSYLYKVLSIANWEASQTRNELVLSAKDDLFIHFSKENQVERVITKHWHNASYVLLKIDTSKLPGKLVLEANPGGTEKYYHLYEGSVPFTAIVEYSLISPDTKLSTLLSTSTEISIQS